MNQVGTGSGSSISRRYVGRCLATLCFVLGMAGCTGDDNSDEAPEGETEGAVATTASPGGDGSGGECVDGTPCECVDGSPSVVVCAADSMCWCPGDFGGSTGGGETGECGTSVTLSGAYDGTFDDQRCGVGNQFGEQVSFIFGAILEPEVFTVTVNASLDAEPPIEGTGSIFYTNSAFVDVSWETPADSCAVTVTSIETVNGRERVGGSMTCPQPAVAEGEADIVVGAFDFVGEIY